MYNNRGSFFAYLSGPRGGAPGWRKFWCCFPIDFHVLCNLQKSVFSYFAFVFFNGRPLAGSRRGSFHFKVTPHMWLRVLPLFHTKSLTSISKISIAKIFKVSLSSPTHRPLHPTYRLHLFSQTASFLPYFYIPYFSSPQVLFFLSTARIGIS